MVSRWISKMRSFRLLAFVACVGLLGSIGIPQGLGKGKGDQGGKSSGGQSSGGQSSGGQSTGGGLGKSQGGGSSSGGRTTGGGSSQGGGSNSGGGLGRSQGGNSQGGGSSSGGNTQGGGSSQGGLGKGRGNQGGSSTGGGNTQGGSSSSGGGLGRSQGGGSSSGGRTTGGGSSSGGNNQGGLGRQGGGSSSGGFGERNDQNRGNGQLGRVGDLPDRTNSIGKVQNGRVGQSGYNSNNNLGRNGDGFRIEQPRLNLNKGSLHIQVQRSETIRTNRNYGYNNGWRDGYVGYNNNWRDDYFCYPHYTFNPWQRNCSISPWYYYGHLPGYINASRIFWFNNVSCNWGIGAVYSWDRNRGWNNGYSNNGYDRRNSEIDDAVYDLVNAFERGDSRALGRLIPRHGRVNIYMDDQYTYTLDSDDFYDMMQDNIQSTRTVRYSIDRVRTHRDEVQVSASHEFMDPWGRRQCVYHNYRLEEDRYGYVITDFRSSYRP